ncbi:GNAT family N-acetyltransferase [Microbulbifer harenosus]|uniref:GNAT family N-acetyltransferase n=1 Tax=Microbulbifer harenosus TaxID=2576840 RepID=A0ABY2UPC6_9GAMM|nr:GNAT family N-acetyltransferase [Microbulbifer harenosus]TLM78009.1 GNAT family N-acetyltransferase [Microbulbifer harenosus]
MIETVSKENLNEVLPLFRAYQEFYKVQDICDKRNEGFLSKFFQPSELGGQFLFRKENKAVGFATVYFTFTSTIISKVAILNDLYTQPENRGEGIGRELIEHCREFAKDKGAARLQWVTAPENNAAQKLYDSMGLAKSSWFFYTYNT